MKQKKGRKRIGQPISITLTEEQRAWVDSQIVAGGTRTEVIRKIIQQQMEQSK
jgi:Arc/MetJ-type ribon-helix-helix transcriptional regulator